MKLVSRDRKLRQHYAALWPSLWGALKPLQDAGRVLSEPFLMDMCADKYDEAEVRILYVGRETNGWDSFGDQGLPPAEYVDHLRQKYAQFGLGALDNYKNKSRFWKSGHRFFERLNPDSPANGFLWTNLFKVDEKSSTPDRDVRLLLARHFAVLKRELELARPDVALFVCGHDQDDALSAQLPGVTMWPFPGRELWEVAILQHESLPPLSFRTYHPQAAQWDSAKDYLDEIADYILTRL